MGGLGENLEKKIIEIINFMEIKLQFHFIPKEITYGVEGYGYDATRIIILPFWPVIKVKEILTVSGESIIDFQLMANKLLINPSENLVLTPYLIKYNVGYNWKHIKDFLPILLYLIEYYLQQYVESQQFTTNLEIKTLMDDMKNLYGKGDL